MQRPSLLRRLAVTVFLLVLATLTVFGAAVLRTVGRLLNEGSRQHAEAAIELLEPAVRGLLADGALAEIGRLCRAVGQRTHVTVMRADGTVIGDSHSDATHLDNHLNRPEIRAATVAGEGFDRRYSHSAHARFTYLARRLDADDGRVLGYLRVAAPTALYERARREALQRLLVALLLLLPITGLLSYRLMRQLAVPLTQMRRAAERFAAGDFGTPVRTAHSHEMDALAECLNVMAGQLDARLREVTQQRNETEAILRGMTEGVVAVDGELRILRMNRAAAELFGVEAVRARGPKLIEVMRHPILHDALAAALRGDVPRQTEFTLTREAGDLNVEIQAARLPNGGGAVAVLHDATRVRRLESMRRDFVANVSHELRTPITAIVGFVETLAEGAVEDPHMARRFLATVQRHSERLGRIIEDLLLLSRLDSQGPGGDALPREQLRVIDLAQAAAQALEPLAADRATRIEWHIDPALSIEVCQGFVQPALTNLVDNAVKYSPAGTTVRIAAAATPDAVRIAVTDQGPGIPVEHRARIFERFYRIDKGRSRELGGTGLGLAIVKHVMSVHGGTIELATEEGRGATFTLVFPRPPAADADREAR